MDTMPTTDIAVHELPRCPVCASFGRLQYQNLTDDLCQVPGMWSMYICTDHKCGTYWLNPAPLVRELGKLYESYTTHSTPALVSETQNSLARRLLNHVRSAIYAKYQYKSLVHPYLQAVLRAVARIHPGWYNSQLNQLLYVPFIENGHLLDVGCGNGNAMVRFRDRGWRVTGIDFDESAIREASTKGLDVYTGDLKEIQFPSNTYDVVFLSHVIEHVPEPIAFLSECYRILKPGGLLIALTPNADSRSHVHFREHWRGLEIPRHLQVFTPASLANTATQAGFTRVMSKTCMQGTLYLHDASAEHTKSGSFDIPPPSRVKRLLNQVRLYTAGIRFALSPGKEETILLQCQK